MISVKTAFVLAAGRGERLRPLTDKTPKPLLPVKGKPILERILENLIPLGIEKVVLNAWHLKEQILEFTEQKKKAFPFKLEVSLEEQLLGTGGGLKKALPLIGSPPFLMLNGDCLWTGELKTLLSQKSNSVSTWVLTQKQADQTVIGVKDEKIVKIGNLWTAGEPMKEGCFSGIQLIRKIHPDDLPNSGCIIRNYFLKQLERGENLDALFGLLESWTDIGTVDRYQSVR